MIDAPQADGLATLPFRLWPQQVRAMWLFVATKRAIVLKARQLGISWLVCGYVLWLSLFQPGRVALMFSKGQLEADELARRVSVMYSRLPEWMRAELPAIVTDNTSEIVWSNGSRVQSLPATENAGRSFTASIVVMDEMAFMSWADKLYSALKPTIDGGGQLFIVSTANGRSNLFARLWKAAVDGINGFTTIFLPWWSRPDRTQAWYADVAREAVSQSLMDQEYPAKPEDAFNATDAEKFIPILWWDALREVLPPMTRSDALVIGLDGSVNNDSTALVAVSRHPARHDDVAVRHLNVWEPKGGQISFSDVERTLDDIVSSWNVIEVAFDPYQLQYLAQRIRAKGRVMVTEFSQGGLRLEADKHLLDLITQRRLAHDGNAQLRAHVDNADKKVDGETRKLRLMKREPSLKIDAAVALSMAAYRCLQLPL